MILKNIVFYFDLTANVICENYQYFYVIKLHFLFMNSFDFYSRPIWQICRKVIIGNRKNEYKIAPCKWLYVVF